MKRMLAAICIGLAAPAAIAEPTLDKLIWETGGLRTPESVLVSDWQGEPQLLVSEIEGGSSDVDGQGGIALLALDGTIIERDFIRGLSAPKGMAVAGTTLYVADIHELVAVDLKTQTVLARYPVADSVFLNDVAIDSQGTVYVSDTRTGKVHRLRDGEMDTYLEGLDDANGLYTEEGALIVGAGKTLYRVIDGEVSVMAKGFAENIDGVEALKGGGYIVSCWVGQVYRVGADGEVSLLHDSRDPQMNTADIGYHKASNTLFIPTFLTDTVRAYAF